ncbi:MAG: P1 family peptidase [Tumebacillaceae bacterium]
MLGQKRIRHYGFTIGTLPTGPRNSISDVAGVTVGHCTLNDGPVKTGVTAILPHPGNLFQDKVLAAAHVINGFGKTAGTIQIEELGTIETPILLTNTLSVGTAADALIEYMLERNPDIGVTTGTVNAVVGECNDMYLNDIRGRHVQKEHVFQALDSASADFAEGAVGAGTGMSCYGLKGGIGSASRRIELGDESYMVGVLVLSNFGAKGDLTIGGVPFGRLIEEQERASSQESDKGSIMIVLATDLPLSERQLKRVGKRAAIGLARTGSFIGHGSGDIVLAFTTANRVPHAQTASVNMIRMVHEDLLDPAFRAAAEATEEAVLNSMICAQTTVGRDGNTRHSLQEYMHLIQTTPGP